VFETARWFARWEMPGEISLGTAVLACRGVAVMENAVFEGCCGWCVVVFGCFIYRLRLREKFFHSPNG
jgi:hypothetical protein